MNLTNMLKIYDLMFWLTYNRARFDIRNKSVFNGYPVDSQEFRGYKAGLASKGVTQ